MRRTRSFRPQLPAHIRLWSFLVLNILREPLYDGLSASISPAAQVEKVRGICVICRVKALWNAHFVFQNKQVRDASKRLPKHTHIHVHTRGLSSDPEIFYDVRFDGTSR
jgi:hypothetical protein